MFGYELKKKERPKRIILRFIGVGCLIGVVMAIMWIIFGGWTSILVGIISLWFLFLIFFNIRFLMFIK